MKDTLTVLHGIEAWRYWDIVTDGNYFYLKSLSDDNIFPFKKKVEAFCSGQQLGRFLTRITLLVAFMASLKIFLWLWNIFCNDVVFLDFFAVLKFWLIFFFTAVFCLLLFFTLYVLKEVLFSLVSPWRKKHGKCSCLTTIRRKEVPSLHGKCGIHGYKTVGEAVRNSENSGDVLGRVFLFGNIIEHQLGYRAQYAYPLSIEQGVCQHCMLLIPIEQARLALYDSGEKLEYVILCETCFSKGSPGYYPVDPNWKQILARSYQMKVGEIASK